MVFIELLKKKGLGLAIAAALSLPGTANAQYWHGGGWHGGGDRSRGRGRPWARLVRPRDRGRFRRLRPALRLLPLRVLAPAPAYYAPPPVYPYRTCWYPQFNGYYAC